MAMPAGEDAVALDEATRLEGDGGVYSAGLSRSWEIWGPNGGYLAAIALRAAGARAELGHPASLNCQFLRAPDFGPADLTVEHLKRSRRSEALEVRMAQQGKLVLVAHVRTTAAAAGYEHPGPQAPEVKPPEALKTTDELWSDDERPRFRFWHNIERRPIDQSWRPAGAGVATEPVRPVVREWARFRPSARFDDPYLDAARALILLDTYGWPAAYRLHRDGRYVAPNLDTSAWFHRLSPHSAWLLIDHECVSGHLGLLGVSGKVWDEDRRLVATGSAQLCCVPAPRG